MKRPVRKTTLNHVSLRIYFDSDKQVALIKTAAGKSQKTERPNISRFVREAIIEKAERITKGAA